MLCVNPNNIFMKTVEQVPTQDAALKEMVREKYSQIALQPADENVASCCGATSSCCGPEDGAYTYTIMAESYEKLPGYTADADLGLGCGLPTEYARLRPGDTVLDLGSGAGNDAFVARHEVGETGRVIGVDFALPMLEKARANAAKLGFDNVQFREGDIEHLPVAADQIDVVISNCVLNLVPNKAAVFAEIKRVLRPGGHFSISDVVLTGTLPEDLREAAELYAGCVSGAVQLDDYLRVIAEAGFEHVLIEKQKPIRVPDQILAAYTDAEGLAAFQATGTGIFSVTVFGRKPLAKACCPPNSGCC